MKFSTCALASMVAAAVSAAPTKRDLLDGKTVTTWWGQSSHELSDVCNDGSFDVVFISFLTNLNPPALNLGSHSYGASAAQKAKGWNGMLDGTVTPSGGQSVADQIKGCQAKGKKVMISFGGDKRQSSATFSSQKVAQQGADYVWNLFLGGQDQDSQALRPFGKDVILDGIDLDNESGNGSFYIDFLKELRSKMNGDKSRHYYISADPECATVGPNTDDGKTSIPDDIFSQLDFLNVQFYNSPDQGIGGSHFDGTIKAWASKIQKLNSNAKMLMGAPSSRAAAPGAGPAIQSADQIKSTIKHVQSLNLPGFGGVSVWDAGYAMDNNNWQKAVKGAL